jgi:hypothetical protein
LSLVLHENLRQELERRMPAERFIRVLSVVRREIDT